jgi:hypothetical protein
VDGYSDGLQSLDCLDAHGVDDASEADDEVILTLFGQHRFEGI